MAVTYNDALYTYKSVLASGHFTDGKYIQGGYAVFPTIADRDAAKVKTADDDDHDGVIVIGSFCYVQATSKFYYCTAIDTTNEPATATWSEFLASGSTNYFSFVYLNDEYDPALTLIGDNVNIALRSLVPVFYMGSNLGSGVIFKRDYLAPSATQNRYYYYVLFPDATKLGDTWINGAIFESDSATTPSNLTFVSWSVPSTQAQITEALTTSLPTIQWEDDATVEISGLSITNNFS